VKVFMIRQVVPQAMSTITARGNMQVMIRAS
jgi:hypothetical protein